MLHLCCKAESKNNCIIVFQICSEEGVGGGISIKNIGGVFIVIFGGIILALLTLLIEFIILKIGNALGCQKCSFTSEKDTRVQGYN